MNLFLILEIIVALTVAGGLLFGGNYLLYRTVVRFFQINRLAVKNFLFWLFLALAFTFPVSAVLSRMGESVFIRVFYIFSSAYLAVLLNLIMGVAIIRLITWLFDAGSGFNFVFSAVIFFAALVFSAYGFWNAFHPSVRNLDVSVKNLPDSWRDKKIAQIADVHLGHVNSAEFMAKIAEKINNLNPDLIFITGDLFDGMDGDTTSFIGPLKSLKAPDGVYFVTGNHETYLDTGRVFDVLKKTNIKVLNNEMIEIDGLQIIGLSYGQQRDAAAIIKSLEGFDSIKPNILLYHTPFQADRIKETGTDLQLSGHTHNGQLFPVMFISRLIYGKYVTGFHKEGDFSIYTTSGAGTWGPPMRTGSKPEIVLITLK